jgi:hypothetical protein
MYNARPSGYLEFTVKQTRDPRGRARDAQVVAATIRHLRRYGYTARWEVLERLYIPGMSVRQLARAWLDRAEV